MTKNARQLWCVKCSTWKWANGTKCYCKAKESGKALDGWVDLSDASRQDLQATLKSLEAAKQNASAAPQAVSALEERIQQVKDAIYRCDPLHVQISKIQTAIGRAENTVKNRREQVWRSQEALTKAQDHLWELQGRLEQVTQRKEEEDQGYDSMDLQDGPGSWWDADSPGSDDVEHARESSSSPQSWQSWGGYQPPQEWHRSQGAIEDLSTKFAEMQQYIGNITTQYSAFQAEVMLAIQTLTNQQKQSATIVSCGPVPVTPRASPQPQLLQSSQSKRPAGDKADGDDSPRKFMVGADDDDLLIDQLGQPSDLQPDLAQESL